MLYKFAWQFKAQDQMNDFAIENVLFILNEKCFDTQKKINVTWPKYLWPKLA